VAGNLPTAYAGSPISKIRKAPELEEDDNISETNEWNKRPKPTVIQRTFSVFAYFVNPLIRYISFLLFFPFV
jgi:hypothetical protein